ncbi:metal-dependent hydrolase [Paenibacillus sp. y28]|uniref:metal-dependent hydrolase n=1 Tax=Paenibacillus sp. y28 TaxID=3129110 RepID=UPI003017C379
MNNAGHLSLGMLLGTLWLGQTGGFSGEHGILGAAITLVGVAIGSRAPDIDHKTSTASKLITPFPAHLRRKFNLFGSFLTLVGLSLCLFRFGMLPAPGWLPDKLLLSAPLVTGSGLLLLALSRLRDLILLGVGALVLAGYMIFHWHWFAAFAGVAVMAIPFVRHRGIIHTPEFAMALTIGGLSLVAYSPWWLAAFMAGLVIGWWTHLAGDLPGKEGIHSLFVPRLKLALNLFANGGKAERWVTRVSWSLCVCMWVWMLAWPGSMPVMETLEHVRLLPYS